MKENVLCYERSQGKELHLVENEVTIFEMILHFPSWSSRKFDHIQQKQSNDPYNIKKIHQKR
jgi:hypothetical protein